MTIENHLAELRQKRGLSAADLAAKIGVSRQTIYAMEAGNYVPNTTVALKLARVLETRVEDLFRLPDEEQQSEPAWMLPGSEARTGQPVQLCRVDKKLVASAPSPFGWYYPASDAIVTAEGGKEGRARVQAFQREPEFSNRILVAGCDPGISVLARHLQVAGVELVLAHRNSSQALELLKQGTIHVAGTHLRDESSGESNLPEVLRTFAKNAVAVISFAVWEEGIVTAVGNPKTIRGVEDLARPDVRIVNREAGAGSRRLLDNGLRKLGIEPPRVHGYNRLASGHLEAAWEVSQGDADACIAPRGAARLFGLGFVPLVSERYDLALRRQHLELPAIQTLFETVSRSSFRRELESLGGYDADVAGKRIL